MLSSTDCEEINKYNKSKSLNRVSSTSSSPSNNLQTQTQQRAKTMEEVWKEINRASLHDHDHHPSRGDLTMTPTFHNPQSPHFILQDFFPMPSIKDPPTSIVSTNGDTSLYDSPFLPPDTVLSLKSSPYKFGLLDNSVLLWPNSHLQSHHNISNVLPSFDSPFGQALGPSSGFASFGKERVQESAGSSSNDRRHRRMIKNRESASRSRARKQAYTTELQLEVDQLKEENARLKRQQEQKGMKWRLASASQVPKKHTLHRTSTAPF